MLIHTQDMLPLLVEACPSFAPRWEEGSADSFLDKEGNLLMYIALGSLAHHLVNLGSAGKCDEFPAVFAVVERLQVEGDHDVREAATIGLLEGVQNHAGWARLDTGIFLRHLGPESRKWWEKLEQFWQGNPHALREEP
ncbi:MAG TPA: hypothetical protein VHP11_00790 [Tepidisphaeraceae bacterium]|nr:hypothetical protein [Tepidisphaeraceae bacterium]